MLINTGYWGEKLEAVKRHGGYLEYDADMVREQVEEHLESWIKWEELSEEDAKSLREAAEEEINYGEGRDNAYSSISSFEHKIGEEAYWEQSTRDLVGAGSPKFKTFQFQDIFEWRWEDYTAHYVWCCYAIVWGINQYDALKEAHERVVV